MSRRYTTLDQLDRLGAETTQAETERERRLERTFTPARTATPTGRPRSPRARPPSEPPTVVASAPRLCQQPGCTGWPDRAALAGQLSCQDCTDRLEKVCKRLKRAAERAAA